MLERTVKNLLSICNTHERTLETFQQSITDILRRQAALDLSYEGEELEVMTGM